MDFIAGTYGAAERPGTGADAVDKYVHAFGQPATGCKNFPLESRVKPHHFVQALIDSGSGDIDLPHAIDKGLQRGRDIDFNSHDV
jgi:hypothetical protein